jgi:hypothetical protein
LADLVVILKRHGHDARIDTHGIFSRSLPLYLSNAALAPLKLKPYDSEAVLASPVYFIETGDQLDLDVDVDIFFGAVLREQPQAHCHCSHCYAHFTPTVKEFEVRTSQSCTISFPRTNPVLYRLVQLPLDQYLSHFMVGHEETRT